MKENMVFKINQVKKLKKKLLKISSKNDNKTNFKNSITFNLFFLFVSCKLELCRRTPTLIQYNRKAMNVKFNAYNICLQ